MENKNIFEGAKFGDKFVTNDNRIAKFICITKITENVRYCLYVENEQVPIWYDKLGNNLLNKEKLNIVSHYQELSTESSGISEEIVINNQLDKPCQLYKGEKMIGIIYNSTALYDVLVQLYLKEKEGIDVSEYYIMFENQKLKRSKHNGRLLHVPHNFFNTDKDNLAILFQLNE